MLLFNQYWDKDELQFIKTQNVLLCCCGKTAGWGLSGWQTATSSLNSTVVFRLFQTGFWDESRLNSNGSARDDRAVAAAAAAVGADLWAGMSSYRNTSHPPSSPSCLPPACVSPSSGSPDSELLSLCMCVGAFQREHRQSRSCQVVITRLMRH